MKDGKYKLPRRNINVYIYTVEHKDTKRGYVIVNLPDITGAKLLSGDRKHKIEEAFLDPNESMSAMRKRLFSKRRRRIRWP